MRDSLQLDHLVLAVAELDRGVRWMEETLRIEVAAGGTHDGFGTHNAVFGLGDGTYFEIIAADPGQPGGALADAVGRPETPELMAWAVRIDEADAVAAVAEREGLEWRMVRMERATPAGDLLRWKVVAVGGHPHQGALPFFIDWMDTPHPSRSLAAVASLRSFEIGTPDPDHAGTLLHTLGVDIPVVGAEAPQLRAVVGSSRAEVALSGPARGLIRP